MVKIRNDISAENIEMRQVYCSSLIEAAKKDPKIVTVDCDLSSSCGTKDFSIMFPERSFNVGIAEQNGCAMAGGLAASGLKPFFHSFAVFSSRRVYDQIFISCAYARQNVKIVGCDPGITAENNGGTHMAFEDVGILRAVPEVTIVEPTDTVMLKNLLPKIVDTNGLFYIRLMRKKAVGIYDDGSDFVIGKAAQLRSGNDVTIIAAGIEVAEALKAADQLKAEAISARVIDMFTIKPLDKECVLACARETGAIVTAENGNIIGGLGSAVAEVLSENLPTPLERVGVRDCFGQVGSIGFLKEKYGLTAEVIAEKARIAISRKTRQ